MATFSDEGPLDCAWNVSDVVVAYTALRPGRNAEQMFRHRRRASPTETRDVADVGDEAYSRLPDAQRPDSVALNVREGDDIFILSVIGPEAATLRDELIGLAELVLQGNSVSAAPGVVFS